MSQQTNNFDLVVFDLDGTLVNSIGDINKSYCQACDLYGFPHPTVEEVAKWVGMGHEVAVNNCFDWLKRELKENPSGFAFLHQYKNQLDDKDVDEIYNKYLQPIHQEYREKHKNLYLNVGHSNSVLFPGVTKSIKRLKQHGVKVAVLTNKMKELTPQCLNALGIYDLFDKTFSDGELQHNKPHPEGIFKLMQFFGIKDKQRVLMVGDSSNDIKAGTAAEVKVLGLSYGYNYGIPIDQFNPTYVSDHFCACVALNEGIELNTSAFECLCQEMEQ